MRSPGKSVIPLEFLFRASHVCTLGKALAGCVSYGQEVVMSVWLHDRAELCQCRLSEVLSMVIVPPISLSPGWCEAVGAWVGKCFLRRWHAVWELQVFLVSAVVNQKLPVRLGDELFFPKLGGNCSLGLWAGDCEGGVAVMGTDQGLGMRDLVLWCPSGLWWVRSLAGAGVNWDFSTVLLYWINGR